MTKKKHEIPQITMAKIMKLDPNESINLTSDFLSALKPEIGEYAIIVLTPNTKIIRIIPTNTNKVYKIGIDIGKLTPDFLRKIGNLFLALGLKSLYSTGLCFVEETCVFDGYVDSDEFEKIDINELKNKIMLVDGITGVNISILEVE
ncbi:MAG: hypothetical protein FK734_06470 [Asgard group archaeon]|nr:hypothetical protein [Asgard group archaeon]